MNTENGRTENLVAAAIEEAEEVRDPLDGLVEKTAADPGAPFAPDALEWLATLKKEDRAAFEALRSQLKKAGCRVTALDEAIAEENGDAGGRGPKQADILIAWRNPPSCSTRRTAPASPTSTSTAIAKPGRSAPRAFADGSPAASTRKRAAHLTRRRCNRR